MEIRTGSVVKARRAGVRRGLLVLMATMIWATAGPLVADDLPVKISGLLPEALPIKDGSWEVFETEFGKSFMADLRFDMSGYASSCDYTIGAEGGLEIKGDTAWEEPPMLDMAVQMYESDIDKARSSLPASEALYRSSNSHITSFGAVQEEAGPYGDVLTLEYSEDCAKRPHATNTLLRAFSRKGATMMYVTLWIGVPAVDARALVLPMLESFQALDFAPLLEGATPE